ncbi:BTB-protein-VII isoform X3 [Leptinotarsa decemlineata]|uniref:BTB-protein-VII isoform X3 n=1 Tax=Leptinotarsa decemlineata TaxID=7539 RepID=UPI003D3075BF
MTVQQYCLRWNNHQPNFISVFSSLLSSQSLVDVTLAAEGKHLQAHKVVLSACSSYFQSLFASNPCKHPIVILKDVKFGDLRVMVDFMYHGEVSVSQEQLPCILKTAEMLKIKGLTEIPVDNSAKKCQTYLADKSEISPHPEENWNLEETNRATSPSSPSSKRRRLKKNVICNTATITEPTEGPSNEILVNTVGNVFETVLKSEADITGQKYNGNPTPSMQPGTSQQRDPEPTHQILTQLTPPEVNTTQSIDCSTVEIPRTCTTQPSTGIQWNVMDQSGFMHYTSSTSAVISNNIGAQFIQTSNETTPASPHTNTDNLLVDSNTISESYPNNNKRKRNFNPQGDENFLRALEAVRFGGIGFCKAARMLSIKNRHQAQVQAAEGGNADRGGTEEPAVSSNNAVSHPIAIISSAVFDSKQVAQRSKYFDEAQNPTETINFQSINLEHM